MVVTKIDTGVNGTSPTVVSCEKTKTEGLVDTYTITFSDNTKTSFTVTNAEAAVEITEIAYDEAANLVTVKYSDDNSFQFALTETSDILEEYKWATAFGGVGTANERPFPGYSGSETEWVKSVIKAFTDKMLGGASALEAKQIGAVLPAVLNKYNDYFNTVVKTVSSRTVQMSSLNQKVGYYYHHDCTEKENVNYLYLDPITVQPGEVMSVHKKDGSAQYYLFLVAKKGDSAVTKYCVNDSVYGQTGNEAQSRSRYTYTVPEGVDNVVISQSKNLTDGYYKFTKYSVSVELKSEILPTDIAALLYGGASNSGNGATITMKNESISATAATLKAGTYLKLEANHVMNNKTLSLSFRTDAFDGDDVIRLGHGESNYGGTYVEITKTNFKLINYSNPENHESGSDISKNEAHGLTLSGVVNIVITTRLHDADVYVSSSSGVYKIRVSWSGRNGEIFAYCGGRDITDVNMRWSCSAYESDIWLLGDSYFNSGTPARWPYYLRENGFTDYLMMGYPGRNSLAGLADFKQALTHGTPKYAVWCLGMNDGDSSTAINTNYANAVKEFLEICEDKGITPILSTTPCTPKVRNDYKNAWVRNSGYRYVDFSRAVGGDAVGSSWYAGMLYENDQVHPNVSGAYALYVQFIADFPEICR